MIGKEGKRGQVTVFIIIAVLVVALGVLIYAFYPKLVSSLERESKNPSGFIQECAQEDLEETVKIISLQGGNYVTNENNGKIYRKNENEEIRYVRYLCYTNEDYSNCINQEPFLKKHIESEILNAIYPKAEECFDSLVESYEKKGYDAKLEKGTPEVKILPNSISTDFNVTLTLVKGGETEKYQNFDIVLDSSLYDMLGVVKNIILWEIYFGNSIGTAYETDQWGPFFDIDRNLKEDNVVIYSVSDINTKEVFRFAVRGFAIPVGF